jgi:hypothetical protein
LHSEVLSLNSVSIWIMFLVGGRLLLDDDDLSLDDNDPVLDGGNLLPAEDDPIPFDHDVVLDNCSLCANEDSRLLEDCRAPQLENPLLLTEGNFAFEIEDPLLGALLNE